MAIVVGPPLRKRRTKSLSIGAFVPDRVKPGANCLLSRLPPLIDTLPVSVHRCTELGCLGPQHRSHPADTGQPPRLSTCIGSIFKPTSNMAHGLL